MEFDELSRKVIGLALEVHRELGPGLLESAYEQCLAHELTAEGIAYKAQMPLPVKYKDLSLNCGYRVDLMIEKLLIVEIKSINAIHPIHEAQILTYMKLADITKGLLINFNSKMLKSGIKRFVL